jgi:hypothetical protein
MPRLNAQIFTWEDQIMIADGYLTDNSIPASVFLYDTASDKGLEVPSPEGVMLVKNAKWIQNQHIVYSFGGEYVDELGVTSVTRDLSQFNFEDSLWVLP